MIGPVLDSANGSSEDLRKDIVRIYRVTCSRRTVERIIEKLDLQKKIQLP
jgi:hypothetical protein